MRNNMGKPTISRRRFLRDLGVSAGAVPLLAGLDTLYAKAQVPTVPKKRFIVMYTPNGQLYSSWRVPIDPATAGTTAPFITDITTGAGATAFASPTTIWGNKVTATGGAVAPPLSNSASKLLILDRLSMIAGRPVYNDPGAPSLTLNGVTVKPSSVDGIPHPGGHQKGMGSLLTGQVLKGGANNFGSAGLGNGISIDQVLANNLFKGKVKFPSLQLAVMGTNDLYGYDDRQVDKEMSYSGPVDPIVPVSDPFVLFNTVFGAPSTGTAMGSGPTPQQLADKSVLDAVQADFMRLQTKLSSADWQLLQQHQSAVRDIETQLTSVFTLSCSAPSAPAAPNGVTITNPTATLNWTEVPGVTPLSGKMLMDIMIQAVACGLTNIVTFQWTHSEDNLSFPWLTLPPSQCNLSGVGHHNMSHERDPNLLIVDSWYASQFNYMITQLDGIQESGMPGTTVLDNSLLMYTSCLSDGSAHISDNAYFALAGSNGGYFKTGKLIRFNDVYTPLGVGVDPLSNEWYTKTGAGGGVQTAQQDQGKVGSPDLSNNDLFGSIFDSFGLVMETVAPTIADPRFFHGNLPGVKVGS
jgi:hypothetical protein